jgi:hypothetical protein
MAGVLLALADWALEQRVEGLVLAVADWVLEPVERLVLAFAGWADLALLWKGDSERSERALEQSESSWNEGEWE